MPLRDDMIAVYIARPGERKSHEFLQLRRAAGDYMGGTWSTVYGCVEAGETAASAALRELREETGLSPNEFYRLPTVRAFHTPHNDTTYIVPAFCAIADREAQIVLNSEHTAFRWSRRDHAGRDWLWATDRAAIEEIVNEILSPASMAREHLRIALPLK